MDPFNPGELTLSQSARLNEMSRAMAAVRKLYAQDPLAINWEGGIPRLSVSHVPEEMLVCEVTGNDGGDPPLHTVKRKTRAGDNTLIDYDPLTFFDKVLSPLGALWPDGTLVGVTLFREQPLYRWGIELAPAADATFLALLVGKDYDSAPFITYSWVRVKDTAGLGGASEITYDFSDLTSPVCGGPGCFPAFHVRNLDLPAWTGNFSPGGCCDPPVSNPASDIEPRRWSVVRMHKGKGDWYVFGEHPWHDLFRRTGVTDADGEQAFLRVWDQTAGGGGAWVDSTEVRLIVAG